jgi:threonine/homoserine/homoserine lactone efflux protein
MLIDAIGGLLPSAIGVALSPIPIIGVILILDTPRARSNGPAFGIGWVLGMVVVSVLVLTVAGGADDPSSSASDGVNWVTLLLGLAFFSMAARQWRSRPKKGETPKMPKWMSAIDRVDPPRAFLLGAALSGLNPKNLALTLAASAAIAQAGLSAADDAIAVAVFVVIASITVVGSVLLFLFGGDAAAKPLASIKEFMTDHSNVIMMVVLLVLGAKLVGNGLAGVSH